MIQNDDKVSSIFFTFNPNLSKGMDEIWLARIDGEIVDILSPKKGEGWLEKTEKNAYYYNAISHGRVWSNITYEIGYEQHTVSYSKSVYTADGTLLGVAGVDILAKDILEQVSKIKAYESGTVALADAEGNYITGSLSKSQFDQHIQPHTAPITGGKKESGLLSYENGNADYLVAYAGLSNGWWLIVNQPAQDVLAPFSRLQLLTFVSGMLILLLGIIYAFTFSKKHLRPVVEEYNQKDLYIYNQARQAKLGEMIGNIAHQWKQPLNSIAINAHNIKDFYHHDALTADIVDTYIKRISNTVTYMAATIDDFSSFLKPDKKKESFDVESTANYVLTLMEYVLKKESVTVKLDCGEVTVYGYRNEFAQVLFNVLSNAIDALKENPGAKNIFIKARFLDKKQSQITVINNGKNIPDDDMKRLFEPYFTTKPDKEGTGLGLHMSKEIIETNMGGAISLENQQQGVICRITVPRGERHVISETNESPLH